MLLPERYRIGCADQLGLIPRAVIVWAKVNGLPESVGDRVRRSHEDWVHLVKRPDYYTALDHLREPNDPANAAQHARYNDRGAAYGKAGNNRDRGDKGAGSFISSPLGKMPGSVWALPSDPLRTPPFMGLAHPADMAPTWLPTEGRALAWADAHQLTDAEHGYAANRWPPCGPTLAAGPDHFAAFPPEWPRRLILGWSPSGVCEACGEGRRPVVEIERGYADLIAVRPDFSKGTTVGEARQRRPPTNLRPTAEVSITGEACGCGTPDASSTRPAVVLDPFAGTGTTAAVAGHLGRLGIGLDLSRQYVRLARWRAEGDVRLRSKVRAAAAWA